MSKELLENLRSVGRLWEDDAADALEAQQKRIEELEMNLDACASECLAARQMAKDVMSDPALDFCHRFAVLMECMILSDKPYNCWDEANSLLEQYHLALEDWREANGEPYVSGFGKD